MAKYDQGGGCPCGLYRECCCEDNALIEATMEPAVVYMSLLDGTVWIRPRAEFLDGRFKRVTQEEVKNA